MFIYAKTCKVKEYVNMYDINRIYFIYLENDDCVHYINIPIQFMGKIVPKPYVWQKMQNMVHVFDV